jgi:probable HAF family extracellular repeat protein
MIAAPLNSTDQAVGNGFLYRNGSIQSLLGLLPAGSGWSNLNATAINDTGQIVGQRTCEGQQVAFLMTPSAVPEPATFGIWGLASVFVGSKLIASRSACA